MKSYVLDSFAMIAFFENERGADKVAEILRQITTKKAKGFMSVINWGEMYYSTVRENGIDEAEKVLKQFNMYSIQLVNADKDLTYSAAKFKARYRIAYADCFAVALSQKLKAPIVTGDSEFEKLSNEAEIIWLE
ncbi:MAG: type II toxin-antitoxin system VapC family toxin [Deltaproteobacteria bacterium]|nr:type II toxin-antitoxin system VapC family toxin [Deltaproteobacteria bacterium]